MKSFIIFFALFLKGILVSHKFFLNTLLHFRIESKMYFWQIGKPFPVSLTWKHCCTFELNLKCIFDKLEHLFPLFPYMKNLVSKAKEQKNNRKWIWNSKKKKNQNIGAHFDLHCKMFANISEKVNRLTQS